MPVRQATAEVFDRSNVLLGSLQYESLSWDVRLNDAGVGEVTVPANANGYQHLAYGNYIRFYMDGVAKFTMMIEEIDWTVVGSIPSSLGAVARGRSWMAELADARVRPPFNVGSLPASDTVYFNYAHPYLNRTAWTTPVAYQPVYEGATFVPGPSGTGVLIAYGPPNQRKEPKGWPDIFSKWIWSQATVGGNHPAGVNYFINTFYAPVTAPATFVCAADDVGEWWVDGAYFIKTEDYRTTYSFGVYLTQGWHQLVCRATNKASNKPAGIAVAAFQQVVSRYLVLENVILRSNNDAAHGNWTTGWPAAGVQWDGWKCYGYGTEPGFTAGSILYWLLDRAQSIGEWKGWTVSFTEAVDSRGTAWPILPEIAIRVGDDILTVMKQLADNGYIDYSVNAATKVLNVWVGGQQGDYYTNPASPPTYSEALGNVVSVQVSGTR